MPRALPPEPPRTVGDGLVPSRAVTPAAPGSGDDKRRPYGTLVDLDRRLRVPRSSAGFTLLEAVVAMAIFAAAGMALYALFNTNLISLGRAQDVTAQIPTAFRAIEYLSAIDPAEQPTGEIELDGYEVTWSSRLMEPVRDSQSVQGYQGYHEVALYEVTFQMNRLGDFVAGHKLRVISHRQVRWPSLE